MTVVIHCFYFTTHNVQYDTGHLKVYIFAITMEIISGSNCYLHLGPTSKVTLILL